MQTVQIQKTQREYGIDLLRIVSMFYIVMLHTLGMGGVNESAVPGSFQQYLGLYWELWVYCALNIFALISGYVGYREREESYHYDNYPVLWLQVVFYSVAVAAIFAIVSPGSVSVTDWVMALLPVTGNAYWYFTAYTGLFFLIPVINAGIRGSSEKRLNGLALILLLMFSAYSTVANRWHLKEGFSCLWLIILYILGAIARKCAWKDRISAPAAIAGIVICTFLSWGWKLVELYRPIFGQSLVQATYLTPTHVISALLHVVLFAKFSIPESVRKWIAFGAPGTFAVYLLNCNPFIWDEFVLTRFGYLGSRSLPEMILTVLGTSAAFVLAALVIDYLRQQLFRLLKVRQLAAGLVRIITNLGDKVLHEKTEKDPL